MAFCFKGHSKKQAIEKLQFAKNKAYFHVWQVTALSPHVNVF